MQLSRYIAYTGSSLQCYKGRSRYTHSMESPNHVVEFGDEEMLQAQVQVFNHVMAHMGSMSLKSAMQLGIPEAIHAHGGPIALSDLIAKLPVIAPIKAPFLHRIMRLLAHMGYFTVKKNTDGGGDEGKDAYSLTAMSAILLKDSPTSFSSCVFGLLSRHTTALMYLLTDWLRSNQPGCAHEMEHGKSMWELASENPEFNSMVNELMEGDTRLLMNVVVSRCKEAFEGLKTLVDVGGGTGTSARTIAEAFPGLKCTVYDLPHVVATVPKSPLVDVVGGNMFEHIPEADAILLKLILHDWIDEDCVKILKKCKEAIPENGGKVIIVDIVLKDHDRNSTEIQTQLYWDLAMMVSTGGKEREEHEWKKIFVEAGFKNYKITTVGLRSLIEVFP